ncbi:unnamed protein product [Trifolium pratense]|uniref:Uncharacterized protein n=1 Tax=Trifolium pratense TaxID=57577 RepID=A0ACB0LVJ7_TRIPR|nr:unnamed protein product [Trifolium pratense]
MQERGMVYRVRPSVCRVVIKERNLNVARGMVLRLGKVDTFFFAPHIWHFDTFHCFLNISQKNTHNLFFEYQISNLSSSLHNSKLEKVDGLDFLKSFDDADIFSTTHP